MDDEAAFDSLAAKANQDRETVPEIVPRDYDETLERVKGMAGAPSRLLVAQALGLNIVFRDFQGTERTPNFEDLVPGMNAGPFDDEARKFSDATIFLIGPNDPCKPAGRKLQEVYGRPSPDFVRIFLESAAPEQRRGLIAMVSKGGFMATGQSVRFIPFRRR